MRQKATVEGVRKKRLVEVPDHALLDLLADPVAARKMGAEARRRTVEACERSFEFEIDPGEISSDGNDGSEGLSEAELGAMGELEGGAPLLSIYGGKITTYRRLAEHALRDLAPHYPHMGVEWTATRAVAETAVVVVGPGPGVRARRTIHQDAE